MTTAALPQDADLGQLRKQARDLQRRVRAGESSVLALVAEHHPSPPDLLALPLSAAQLVLARWYGFGSWPALRRHVEIVTARSWSPPDQPPASEAMPDRFLRLACLTYSDDDGSDQAAAARLLVMHPELPETSIAVAAACADSDRVAAFLAADPALATAASGPHGWSPLLYQAYARHDPDIGLDATLRTARLLLDAGADPGDGRFWHGLPNAVHGADRRARIR